MEEYIVLLNYYGREGYYHTMRSIAKEGIKKYQNLSCLNYYAALPLLKLKKYKDFVMELKSLKMDSEIGLAIHLAFSHCSRIDTELFNKDELKEIDSHITVLRKKSGEKALLHAVNFFIIVERYNKAREYSDKLLKLHPNSSKGLSLRGWVELALENENGIHQAIEYFERSQILSSENVDSILGQISCFRYKGDIERALDAVNNLILQVPDYLPSFIEKTKIYITACKWEEAHEVVDNILEINCNSLPGLQLKAICFLCGDGDFASVVPLLKKLYAEAEISEPLNAGYFYENACLFSKLCDRNGPVLDEMLRFSEKAVQLCNDNAEYLAQMGNQYLLKGRVKEANKIFRNALKVEEISLSALVGLTKAHMAEGDGGLQQAFRNIKLLNEVHGEEASPEIILMTAIMHRCNGQLEKSKQLVSKAIAKHLKAMTGISIGTKYLIPLDPDFLINAVSECLISTPIPCFTTNFVEEICLISSTVLQPAINAIQQIVKACPGIKKAHLLLGKAYFIVGNVAGALNVIKNLIEKVDPDISSAYLLLAQIYSETKEIELASSCLESGLSYDFSLGQHLLYYLVSARILREHGDSTASISTLNKGISAVSVEDMTCSYKMLSISDEVSMHIELAELYHSEGNEIDAKTIIKDAHNKFRNTTELGRITLASAEIAVGNKDTKEAITILNSILPDDPYYIRGRQQLADIYINQRKDYDGYIACYKSILDWCGGTSLGYLLYGNALMFIQKPDKAIEAYEHVLSKEPGNTQAVNRIGFALVKAHQYGRAIGYLKEGAKSEEKSQIKIALAQLLLRMKQYDRAERMLVNELDETKVEECLVTLSFRLQILLLLAKVYVKIDKNESSITALREALEIQLLILKNIEVEVTGTVQLEKRDVANTCTKIASMYHLSGNHGEALNFLRRGLSYVPDNFSALEALSNIYMEIGDQEQCHITCSLILKIDPHNESAFIMMADMAFRRLDFDTAAFHLEQLLEYHPCCWRALAKLIEVRRRAGRLDEVPLLAKTDSDSGTPAGLAYCHGLYSWYLGKPANALQHFHYAKRDSEWAWQSICNMVEICLYPDGDCLPGGPLGDGSKAVVGTAVDDGMATAISIAKGLLSEQKSFCQNKEQHLQWQLLNLTTLLASREKVSMELALKELSTIATAPDSKVDHIGIAVGLATAHIFLKQGSRARNHLKRAARNQWNPTDANNLERVWLLLADHYCHSGKNESAAELLQRTLQHNGSCIKAQELLGQVMEKAQSFKDAVTSYQNAWKMGLKTNLTVGYKLAHAHMKAKHYADAIDMCHEVLKLAPNESRIRKEILEKCRFTLRT